MGRTCARLAHDDLRLLVEDNPDGMDMRKVSGRRTVKRGWQDMWETAPCPVFNVCLAAHVSNR